MRNRLHIKRLYTCYQDCQSFTATSSNGKAWVILT